SKIGQNVQHLVENDLQSVSINKIGNKLAKQRCNMKYTPSTRPEQARERNEI
ncbi:hypothetical protein SNEBB_008984, partial [Seison nebaliae]